jgi:biotin carboxyl carrier protein
MEYRYQLEDKTITVRLEPQADGSTQAVIEDRVYKVTSQQDADGRWTLLLDGIRSQAWVASEGDRRFVHVAGEGDSTFKFASAKRRRRGANAAADGALMAQMPGQVVEVLVSAGERVEAGQALLVLEAMKMEIRVTAPQAGEVVRVLVSAGDVVQRDQPLVEVAVSP